MSDVEAKLRYDVLLDDSVHKRIVDETNPDVASPRIDSDSLRAALERAIRAEETDVDESQQR